MKDNCLYFDITKQERDSAVRYLLGAIINCRREHDLPSNLFTFDEDVNIYLAHLLFAFSLPEYHEMAEPYLSLDTSDVLNWIRATEDRTIRYFIFKVNADHLLIHTAIFDDLPKRERHRFFKRSSKHYFELARVYYEQAAAYHKRIYRRRTGVGEVLEKLSHYFDVYQELLRMVRREYFSFVTSFRDQAFHHFMNQFKHYERDVLRRNKMDHFLDLYGDWLQTRNPGVERKLREIVSELRALDPDFRFEISGILGGREGECGHERKCA